MLENCGAMITQKLGYTQIALAIIAAYFILAMATNLVNPIFEAPDEHHHFFTAVTIANTRKLPVAGDNLPRQEAAQPPLYYGLSALLIAPLDTAVPTDALWFNPYAQLGNATTRANKNAFVPTASWPWPGYVWAVHLLRSLSMVLGSITLAAIYGSGRQLWPQNPPRALLALALVAFLPQFLFLHASITNDTLIICLCALALWQVLRLWVPVTRGERVMQSMAPTQTRWLLFLLGLTLGAAVLSKTAGLLLLVWAMAALGWLSWRYGRYRWRDLLIFTLGPALLMSGWLLWRNWVLYGDPTATNVFITLAGGDRDLTVWQALAQFGRVWQSLFAFFGWMTVQPPSWVYGVWYGIVGGGAAGILLKTRAWRGKASPRPTPLTTTGHMHEIPLWLAGWVFLVFAGWLQFMMRTPADQGRLLFPALLPLALGLAYGLSQFRWGWLAGGGALITAVTCLVVVIPQAYVRPPVLASVPAAATPLAVRLGDLELVAAALEETAVHPGDWAVMTLYWRPAVPPTAPPVEVIEVLGRELALVGKLHTYHGYGRYPATFWPAAGVVAEEVAVQLATDMAVPTEARLFVKLLDEPGEVEVGRLKVTPREWPAADTAVLAHFGDDIELTRADLVPTGSGVAVHLRWQVTAAPGQDYSVFVHMGDPAQAPLAQADGPPLGGDYPTHLWAAGEVIEDVITLTVPEELAGGRLADGRYPIHVGFYDPATGRRLPVTINGQRQPQDAYGVGAFVTTANR